MFPITFVSLGPGEAELITLKGLKALQAADCIFCPETPARDGRPSHVPPTSCSGSTYPPAISAASPCP